MRRKARAPMTLCNEPEGFRAITQEEEVIMRTKANLSRLRTPIVVVSLVVFLAAAVSIGLSLGMVTDRRMAPPGSTVRSPASVLWHAGNFRFLESMSSDLVTFVR